MLFRSNHVSKEDKEYWLSLFDGDLPKMDLPSDYERPKVHTNRGGVHEFELSPKLVSGIKDLARKEGVTNYNIVLSAWSILVHKYTGDEDFVIAITVDSRNEHLNTAGMLASLIPLKLNVNSEKNLRSVLKDNQKVSLEALRHKSYILNNLLTDLQPPICLDRTLLSEIIISYMNFEFGTENNELFETLRFRNPASKADISVFGSDAGGRISFALEYYADLFSPDNMAKISEDFMHILELMTLGDTDEALEFEYSPRQKKNRGRSEKNLKDELSRKIRMFAEKKNTTLSAVMLTTFAALLSRVLLKKDFVIDIEASRSEERRVGKECRL